MEFLGSELVEFSFAASSQSQRQVFAALHPPGGTVLEITLGLQSSTLEYTDQAQFGFGEQSVVLGLGKWSYWNGVVHPPGDAYCTVVLRDNTTNNREWDGSVEALVSYYGAAPVPQPS